MHRRNDSHLEEWATLLEVDLAEELLDERADSWVPEEEAPADGFPDGKAR